MFSRPLLILIVILALPMPSRAQQNLSFLDQLVTPFTDSELSGVGCLTASTLTGGVLVYLMGGVSRIAASMQGQMPPMRVMEGAAAASFIFSSVCYIGAALAPVAMMTYSSIMDNIPEDFPSLPPLPKLSDFGLAPKDEEAPSVNPAPVATEPVAIPQVEPTPPNLEPAPPP